MDLVSIVLNQLKYEGIKAIYEDNQIKWQDHFNDQVYIFEHDIDYEDGKLAWFQSSHRSRELFKVWYLSKGEYLTWVPRSEDDYGCNCELIEWYNDYLVIIYLTRNDIYISVVKDKHISYFNFHGDQIDRKDDVIYFREYSFQKEPLLQRLKLPQLTLLEPIMENEAAKEGVIIDSFSYSNLSYRK